MSVSSAFWTVQMQRGDLTRAQLDPAGEGAESPAGEVDHPTRPGAAVHGGQGGLRARVEEPDDEAGAVSVSEYGGDLGAADAERPAGRRPHDVVVLRPLAHG